MASISIDTRRGRTALMVAHCAGMVDLVALPLWVGTLIARFGLDPQQAGLLATLFLAGVVLASVLLLMVRLIAGPEEFWMLICRDALS